MCMYALFVCIVMMIMMMVRYLLLSLVVVRVSTSMDEKQKNLEIRFNLFIMEKGKQQQQTGESVQS